MPRPFVSAGRWLSLIAGLFGVVAAGCGIPRSVAADPVPLGSPALWNWVTSTTADALKAAESHQDLAAAGVFALNRGVNSSLDGLREFGPGWLHRVDVGVSLRHDLSTSYQIAATQPLIRTRDGEGLGARTRFAYDTAGTTRGQVGLGYDGRLSDRPFELTVFAGLEDQWASDHRSYTFGSDVGWDAIELHARLINKVPHWAGDGERPHGETIDGYQFGLDTRIPMLPWARIRARTFWEAAPTSAGQDREGHSLGLWLHPIQALVLETGTDDSNLKQRHWFARLRFRMKLGGRD